METKSISIGAVSQNQNFIDPSSFHAFEYRGRRLLFDVNSTAVFEVKGKMAYRLLKEFEESGGNPLSAMSGSPTKERAVREISRLREAGLFSSEPEKPEKGAEDYLERLLNHHPNKLLLMVSQSCNYRCVYCYAVENNFPDEGRLMDESTAYKAVDHLFEASGSRKYLTISFFGGEPLLNFPVIRKVVDYSLSRAKEEDRQVEFLMSTNGSLVTDEIADYLVKHEFSMLVSLDGPPEIHNRFRPTRSGGPSHHLSLKGAYRLLSRYPRKRYVKVKAVLNHESHNLLEIAEYLEGLGFTNIGIGGSRERSWGCRSFDIQGNDYTVLHNNVEALLDRFLKRLDENRPLGYNPFFHALRDLKGKRNFLGITCGVGRNCNAVSVDGDIYPCHRYVGMKPFVLGNIDEGLDRAKTLAYYRALWTNGERSCGACWARHICGGECPWFVSREDGKIWPPHEGGCGEIRKGLERAIWLYYELENKHPDYLKSVTR